MTHRKPSVDQGSEFPPRISSVREVLNHQGLSLSVSRPGRRGFQRARIRTEKSMILGKFFEINTMLRKGQLNLQHHDSDRGKRRRLTADRPAS